MTFKMTSKITLTELRSKLVKDICNIYKGGEKLTNKGVFAYALGKALNLDLEL